MLDTTITVLAIVCATSVGIMCLMRWHKSVGYKAIVYLVFACLAALAALLNLSVLFASDDSFIRTVMLAYVGFSTALVLPAARALGRLTYEPSEKEEREDATV